ncbi:SusC/RagA family TonB-linked outer membrane protein [Flavobacterium granuli]|uniref:TonB-linked SusC/RagA family outer membrane protein n=1 Tax=Flavobacterium granuli TaxID=280093 RepID=A0A1M5NJE1_9FLAO|nr:SusC/RagA family TonB-linked outer membrane protein [Flavobacterium granuli]PRZ23286.1 TonB-linked SusC/RagA family outer membrane protein [Flavobacterium granuli]SHG89063.1 TonB-linked outer membrane protein, SusC/RagA family [Flavobacterium granuli]
MQNYSLNKKLGALWHLILIGIILSSTPALAKKRLRPQLSERQQNQISGIITDGRTPLPGVTIAIKNRINYAVLSDFDGKYSLIAKANDTLVVSYIGYKTAIIPINYRKNIHIQLQEDITSLQEVRINAGYYSVKEKERTGSIARITAKDIEKQPVTNVLAAMQGRMAGVNITQTSGVPGSGFEIQIRGRNSLRTDGNSPLYIVDGMPLGTESLGNSSFLSGSILPGAGVNTLSSLNPADIESIEVLKDADATAIYGSRGANGVVLITTKKAKGGKTTFTTNTFSGVGQIARRLKLLNTEQYLNMRRQAFKNDGVTTYPANVHDINGNWDQNRYTDWQKELIGNTSRHRQIDVGLQGGSESTKLLLKMTNYNEISVFHGDFEYKKTAFQFSGNHRSENQKFQLDLSMQYVLDQNDLPGSDLTLDAINLAPNAPALYDNGGNLNWENSTFVNPIQKIKEEYLAKTDFLNAGGSFAYRFFPSLEFKTMAGFTDSRLLETKIAPSTMYNPALGLDNSSFSFLLQNKGYQQSWSLEPQLHWNKAFVNSTLNVLVGATFQERTFGTQALRAFGFANNRLIYNMAAANTITIFNNDNSVYRYNAVFGRVNYTYRNKYIINLTGRRDGSSRFGPGKQFANFGAVGMAWLFGKETLVEQLLPSLSFGKLRSSYGSTGSDQIGDYQFLDTFSSTGLPYQGIIGLQPTRLFNPNFSWERNTKFEAALELGFFNDRVMLTTAYFKNKSDNQLVGIPLPGTTGFASIQSNFPAEVENKGIELEWHSKIIAKTNFSWNTSFNLTFPKNKLVSFPDLAGSTYANQYVVGEPLSIRMVYHYTGMNTQTGLYEFEDYNKDGLIRSAEDRKMLINTTPEFFGGLQNSFTYKNWQFDFLLQFVKQIAPNFNNFKSMPGLSVNQSVDVLNESQPFSAGFNSQASNAYSFYRNSDAAFGDASFVRLKNIALTYTLPTLSGWDCKLYLQGQNILTFTKYKGLDPENYSGVRIPPLRVLTLGTQLTF